MNARALQEAEARLLDLRHDEQQRIAVSAVALCASLAASVVFPPLVFPLFTGGLALGALGISAIWRHWDLVDRLADDCDAYLIPEVSAYGGREARMDRRRYHAALIRAWTDDGVARTLEVSKDLEELANALEDDRLELNPASAMACRRLVSEPAASPLLDETSSVADLRSAINRVRTGFRPLPPPEH